jgi:dihydrofolate reductase
VVTRQAAWQAEGAVGAHSLTEALQQCQDQPDVWVIGGAELYAQALPLAASAHVTEIDAPFEGDAYAPEFDASWVETARLLQTSASGMNFSFVTYKKRP